MEHVEKSSENQDGSLVATSCLKCPFRARSKSMRKQTPPKTTKPIFSYLFHADSHYPLNELVQALRVVGVCFLGDRFAVTK